MSVLRAAAMALAVGAAALAAVVQGEPAFPAKPVNIVVPYPPGGSNDSFARELARKLSDAWRIPVLVDNRPGAGGSTGAAVVSRAAPDGYTLCLLSSSFTTNAAIRPDLPFDPVNGFTPVGMVARAPMLLAVSSRVPAKTALELFGYARDHPGELRYGSSGVGSTSHFATELLMDAAQIRMTHVPYQGISAAVTDLIAGNLDVLVASAPSIYRHAKAGRVRALGVTSAGRSETVPGIAPLATTGVPGYRFELWWGILAPPKTPAGIVHAINAEVNRILATAQMKQAFLREGAEPAPMSPEAFAATIRREIDGWKKVAKEADIRPE